MIPQARKYIVVIVHYGEASVTKKLVDSIEAGTLHPDQLIIIDHAQNPLIIHSQTLHLNTIRPRYNSGYAGGINTALQAVRESAQPQDIMIVCNNDTVFAKDSLSAIQQWWASNPTPVLAGPARGAVNYLTGRATIISNARRLAWYEKTYIHGACLIAPAHVWMDISPLPEQFFMYWEDVAISQKVRATGYGLAVMPNLGITHTDNRAVNSDQLYYLVRNGAWYLEHQSNSRWRLYWHIMNQIRRRHHLRRSSNPTVRQALQAAARSDLGQKKYDT